MSDLVHFPALRATGDRRSDDVQVLLCTSAGVLQVDQDAAKPEVAARSGRDAASHPRGGKGGICRPRTCGCAGRPDRSQSRRQQAYAVLSRRQEGRALSRGAEGAYEKIRVEERGLDLEHLDPPEAIERLIEFTWNISSESRIPGAAQHRKSRQGAASEALHQGQVDAFAVRRNDPHRGGRGVAERRLRRRGRSGAALYFDRRSCAFSICRTAPP